MIFPCPCVYPSARWFKIVVYIDLVIAFVATNSVIGFMVFNWNPRKEKLKKAHSVSKDKEDSGLGLLSDPGVVGFVIGLAFLFWMMAVHLNCIAKHGLKNRNYKKCRQWFYINAAFLLPCLPLSLACAFKGMQYEFPGAIWIFVVLTSYQASKMMIANSFIHSLKANAEVVQEDPVKSV